MTPATPWAEADVVGHKVLNEAALQLVTAAPGDRARLTAVRSLIAPLTTEAQEAAWVRQALAAAVELLDLAVADDLAWDSAVSRVGALLDMILRGEAETTGTGGGSDGDSAGFCLPPDAARELFAEFRTESLEHLDAAERALLEVEAGRASDDAIDAIFRAFHTIKGTSAFLGFAPIAELAHAAETLLAALRDGSTAVSPARTGDILEGADLIRGLLDGAAAHLDGSPLPLPPGYPALLQRLTVAGADLPAAAETALRHHVAAASRPAAAPPTARPHPAPPGPGRAAPPSPAPAPAQPSTIRVRTDRLDQLVELVGELVVAHSQVAGDATVYAHRYEALGRNVAHSGKMLRQLQELATALRMVPLRPLFQRLERLVRELSRESGKAVVFEAAGEDTEIDRNMVDLLADPLVHMLRNAVDHGLEPAAARSAAGKAAAGRIRLSAWHAAGDVVVELSDDGRGLDRNRILARAVAQGLVEPEQTLSAEDVARLIFASGLSTAERVSTLSGRGVGMDVVRRNIEALRGRVEIRSEPGAGTAFRIRLPLTLAITDGMLVRVGGEHYIVPIADIATCCRPPAEAYTLVAGAGELVTWHGESLPLVRLHRLFGVDDAVKDPARGVLVIAGEGARRSALLVDELLGQQLFVAKPLTTGIGAVQGVAGTAILGDGRVGLILDVPVVVDAR